MSLYALKLLRDRIDSLNRELERAIDNLDWSAQGGLVHEVQTARRALDRLTGHVCSAIDAARRAAAAQGVK